MILALLLAVTAGAQPVIPNTQDSMDIQRVNCVSGCSSTSTINVSVSSVTTYQGGTWSVSSVGTYSVYSLSITVAGGVGSVAFSATGAMQQCSTSVPTGAQYSFEIDTNDATAFPVFGNVTTLTGNAGVVGPRFLYGNYLFKVVGATIDGTYNALCVIKQ